MIGDQPPADDYAARAENVFASMDRTRDARHIEYDCTLLDNLCCVQGWRQLRESHPDLVADVELLHGKDFWTTIPEALRTVMAVFAHSTAHTDATTLAAARRGLRTTAAALEKAKIETIKNSRRRDR